MAIFWTLKSIPELAEHIGDVRIVEHGGIGRHGQVSSRARHAPASAHFSIIRSSV